ncbi:MAG: NAD(P)/FAD-dependent oxidoreductase [Thermoleophilia bacterium]
MAHAKQSDDQSLVLPDGATVVVVGGGPAGAFFAIRALRRARQLGKDLDVAILEKKRELCFFASTVSFAGGGCNYCAGGISPRLADVLRDNGLMLPHDVVEGRTTEVTVHGDWKSVELPVPEGREMVSVFRGSRPSQRPDRYTNFDAFLLQRAADEGARVIAAEVRDIGYTPSGRALVGYRLAPDNGGRDEAIEADLAVVAAGVNQSPGMDLGSDRLYQALGGVLPGFRPPQVRKALICEMQADEDLFDHMQGEAHFVLYGSREVQIEMASLIPKGRWITIVLLGKSVDRAQPRDYQQLVRSFLNLPHIERLLPRRIRLSPICLCHPNMTVGVAQNPFGDRIALVGDMAVARLYKDGISSSYLTGTALADCALEEGVDRESLRRRYWPVVKGIRVDNRFGQVVFLLTRVIFSRPVASRMAYQALLTERKTRRKHERHLALVLWRIASGDDTYRHILASVLRPSSVWLIAVGGVLTTIRNYATERVFGLEWKGVGRYPTGVPIEDVEKKRQEIMSVLGIPLFERPPEVERMYSIKVKAAEATVFHHLGRFGDSDREYFTPRMLHVHRTSGEANEVGCTIRYDVIIPWLSFSVVLQKVVEERYLLFRVRDGFGQGGVLAFDIDRKKPGGGFLTIYVAFDFPKGNSPVERLGWYVFRLAFPGFVHDVLWNQSLCKFKQLVEAENG